MLRLSILSIFVFTTYFAVCSLVYASRNPVIGWVIVITTALVIAVVTCRAFRTRDVFGLGFAAMAGLCLPMCLGFVIETPASTKKLVDLGTPIWKLLSLGRKTRQVDVGEYGTFVAKHDLYGTQVESRLPDDVGVPEYRNALRLAACWTALLAGMIGGTLIAYATKRAGRNGTSLPDANEPHNSETPWGLSRSSVWLALGYLLLCGLNYVSENTTLGWLFVIATASLMNAALLRSWQTRSNFKLGFAVFGSVWLSATLGFALETPVNAPVIDLRTPVWNALSLGRGSAPPIEDYTTLRKSTMHDLFQSIGRVRRPNFREIPDIGNTLRLAACWSAILVGLIGGTCFQWIIRPTQDQKMSL